MFGKEIEKKKDFVLCLVFKHGTKKKMMSPRGGHRGHIYYMLIG